MSLFLGNNGWAACRQGRCEEGERDAIHRGRTYRQGDDVSTGRPSRVALRNGTQRRRTYELNGVVMGLERVLGQR